MVITQASQACDAGSIPVARSNKTYSNGIVPLLFCFKQEIGNRTDEVETRQANAPVARL